MEPNWYYSQEGGGQFVVFADANNSCSMRAFAAADGSFVRDDHAEIPGAVFATHYKNVIRSMQNGRIGSVSKRPNLQDAVKKRKLPDDVLAELKRLKRSLVG
jgi:hypothetical protein